MSVDRWRRPCSAGQHERSTQPFPVRRLRWQVQYHQFVHRSNEEGLEGIVSRSVERELSSWICSRRVGQTHVKPASPLAGPWEPKPEACRLLGGYVGTYGEYHEYARDRRVAQLMNEHQRCIRESDLDTAALPVRPMQPHVNRNAAVMWMFSEVADTPARAR